MGDDVELRLSPGEDTRDALKPLVGKRLTMGLRPEDMRINGETGAARLPAQVEAEEPVGNEAFVNLRCGEGELILRPPQHDLTSPGDGEQRGHEPARAQLFGNETGGRLGG